MPALDLETTQLNDLLVRSRAGDSEARHRLANSVYMRLGQLARQMLRRFPHVRVHEETADILNAAMLRFLRALDEVQIRDTSHFYGLAAQQIRRELLDLARRYRGQRGDVVSLADQRREPADDPDLDLDRWCEFHEEVARLAPGDREVFEPIFYHDVSQISLAAELSVSPKTIQRRYRAACLRLHERLGGRLPAP